MSDLKSGSPAPAEAPRCTVSELRAGEENDGPLESTDLFLDGRGISLLCNVLAGQQFTYSLSVDGKRIQGGTVGPAAPAEAVRPLIARLRKAASVVYLAAERTVADDLSDMLTQAASALEGSVPASTQHDHEDQVQDRQTDTRVEKWGRS